MVLTVCCTPRISSILCNACAKLRRSCSLPNAVRVRFSLLKTENSSSALKMERSARVVLSVSILMKAASYKPQGRSMLFQKLLEFVCFSLEVCVLCLCYSYLSNIILCPFTNSLICPPSQTKFPFTNVFSIDAGNVKFSKGLQPHLYKIFSLLTVVPDCSPTTTRSAKYPSRI